MINYSETNVTFLGKLCLNKHVRKAVLTQQLHALKRMTRKLEIKFQSTQVSLCLIIRSFAGVISVRPK